MSFVWTMQCIEDIWSATLVVLACCLKDQVSQDRSLVRPSICSQPPRIHLGVHLGLDEGPGGSLCQNSKSFFILT